MKVWLASIFLFIAIAVTGASADSFTWNFASTPNSDLGPSATFTSNGLSITASTTSGDLFYKVASGDETGLGLASGLNHEVNAGQSIVFDLSSLLSKNVTSLTLTLGSITGNDTATVCGGGQCITFNSSDSGKAVSILSLLSSSTSGQITITGDTGNVLVDEIQAETPVPEPSSLLFVGSGLMMIAGAGRRLFARS